MCTVLIKLQITKLYSVFLWSKIKTKSYGDIELKDEIEYLKKVANIKIWGLNIQPFDLGFSTFNPRS